MRQVPGLCVRAAAPSDEGELLHWRNDEVTRRMSVSPDPVTEDDHKRWFRASLTNPNRHILIGMLSGEAVGMARFDIMDDGSAEASLNLNPAHRGRGLAGPLLALAIRRFETTVSSLPMTAVIRPENLASHKVFSANGFTPVDAGSPLRRYRRPAGFTPDRHM